MDGRISGKSTPRRLFSRGTTPCLTPNSKPAYKKRLVFDENFDQDHSEFNDFNNNIPHFGNRAASVSFSKGNTRPFPFFFDFRKFIEFSLWDSLFWAIDYLDDLNPPNFSVFPRGNTANSFYGQTFGQMSPGYSSFARTPSQAITPLRPFAGYSIWLNDALLFAYWVESIQAELGS